MKKRGVEIMYYYSTNAQEGAVFAVEFRHPRGIGFLADASALRDVGNGSLAKGVSIVKERYERLTEAQIVVALGYGDMHWIYDMSDA